MKVAMESGYNSVAVARANFVKSLLAMFWFHVPTSVGMSGGMNGYVQAEYDKLAPRCGLEALGLKPCELLLGDEAVMRISMRVVQQHEADAAMLKEVIGRLPEVFFEELFRIMVAGNLVHRFADAIANASVYGILLGATPVDHVAEMEDEITGSLL